MNSRKYDYKVVIASKVIIKKGTSILLTREPKTHDWMPGRWSLPGGKIYLNESLIQSGERKIKEETGMLCKLTGLFKIIDILMPNKTVFHFIFTGDFVSGDTNSEGLFTDELKWFSKREFSKLSKDDLSEYYMRIVMEEYFENMVDIIPLDKISTVFAFRDKMYQDWMLKGMKKR